MKIKITGRQISVSDNLKDYSEKKINRLEKYFNQVIDAHLIMSINKIDHTAELIINGDGVQFHAKDKAADLYSAIDLLTEKIDKQIVKYKDKLSSHKNITLNDYISMNYSTVEDSAVHLFQVSNKPTDKIEAFLQMKMNKKDFILFKKGVGRIDSDLDFENKNYGVIYKYGPSYRLLKIPFDRIKDHIFTKDSIEEYEMKIIDDSAVNPKIEFDKLPSTAIEMLSIPQAVERLNSAGTKYIPFFNSESEFFNVIYKNGKDYEVMVPAF